MFEALSPHASALREWRARFGDEPVQHATAVTFLQQREEPAVWTLRNIRMQRGVLVVGRDHLLFHASWRSGWALLYLLFLALFVALGTISRQPILVVYSAVFLWPLWQRRPATVAYDRAWIAKEGVVQACSSARRTSWSAPPTVGAAWCCTVPLQPRRSGPPRSERRREPAGPK